MNELTPIPIPVTQRWREIRLRFVPLLTFLATLAGASLLWREQSPATMLVGEVEPVTANICSPKAGILAHLNTTLLQPVRAGDPIAQVITTEPRVLQSSLAVILAEIQLLRLNLHPGLQEQRYALDYDRLRLAWMEQRVKLAEARTQLQLAESEFSRAQQLHRDKILSQQAYDEALAAKERLEAEVKERSRLIQEQEKNLADLQVREATNGSVTNATINQSIVDASIKVQEEKLQLAEAELSPILLRVPIDGVVSIVHRRSGETIMAGDPIITVAAASSEKITGYARQPLAAELKVGATVLVRSRSFKRDTAEAKILQVGTQMTPIKTHLLPGANGQTIEMGLPILISLPSVLRLMPGEIPDLRLQLGSN